jgi:heat shock protein HtpX
MARRRELFPPDRALQARMALALVAAAVSVVLLVAVVAWLAVAVHWVLAGLVLLYAATGLAATVRPGKRVKRARTAPLAPGIERRVRELLGRLAAMTDVRAPQLAFEPDDAPLSWTTALPWRRAKIHVTTGLVCECTATELEAVLAHELAHIANRDALVMTLVGPPSWVLLGIREAVRESDEPFLRRVVGIAGISWIVALALPGALAARLLSRHRELAADRGAALLTGSPAGVAAALRRLSDSAPVPDLRLALLFFVPRGPATSALWATHPPLERRLAQLDRLERSLHDRG